MTSQENNSLIESGKHQRESHTINKRVRNPTINESNNIKNYH